MSQEAKRPIGLTDSSRIRRGSLAEMTSSKREVLTCNQKLMTIF